MTYLGGGGESDSISRIILLFTLFFGVLQNKYLSLAYPFFILRELGDL